MTRAASVIFHRLAAREFKEARNWYAAKASQQIADRCCDEIDRCVTLGAASPELGNVYEGHYRWLKLRRFPYLLIFTLTDEETVLTVAVAHERRAPGYWRDRN